MIRLGSLTGQVTFCPTIVRFRPSVTLSLRCREVWINCRWLNLIASNHSRIRRDCARHSEWTPIAGSPHWGRWPLFVEQGDLTQNLWDRGIRWSRCRFALNESTLGEIEPLITLWFNQFGSTELFRRTSLLMNASHQKVEQSASMVASELGHAFSEGWLDEVSSYLVDPASSHMLV